ncbi:MAG: DUF4419 domain-containing protein [Flavobacteriaceae bacterium]|nr:DUF4419 domain-containing protein [Flavobacteriaceae bacterium]
MKKFFLLSSMIVLSISLFAQKGITFQVEELSKPEGLLLEISSENIYKRLILKDADLYLNQVIKDSISFPFNVLATSQMPESLVAYGYNSFFNGMYAAYADHRPFVMSPDIIWLLISQGFARHVNANPEKNRHYFIDYQGKTSLIVNSDKNYNKLSAIDWEKTFSEFSGQISQNIGNELSDVLTCNFSTTTTVEKTASEIIIMEAMKPYFEYVVMKAVCGIPEITLEGTPEDWQKVLEKTQKLKKYDLDWWISEIEPLLQNFVNTSNGNIDKDFWQNMFKYHSQKKYGEPKIIDGWIVKFFPYDKDGKRNNLKFIEGTNSLPNEIVKVDLNFIEIEKNGNTKATPLELWAGFVGLEQNDKNYALRPKIGWMVREKDSDNEGFKKKIEETNKSKHENFRMRVKDFPTQLLSVYYIKYIEIDFLDKIQIPDEFVKVKIDVMKLNGKISEEEIYRIVKLFPNTKIYINKNLVEEIKDKEFLDEQTK